MIIPWKKLSDEALEGLIKEFVLREGTDYGAVEQSLETKMQQIRRQLEHGTVLVVYDTEEDSASILTRDDFKKVRENPK